MNLTAKVTERHREVKLYGANVQQFPCAIARLNVYHVCMGTAVSRAGWLAAVMRCHTTFWLRLAVSCLKRNFDLLKSNRLKKSTQNRSITKASAHFFTQLSAL